jgi:hypothetical protein
MTILNYQLFSLFCLNQKDSELVLLNLLILIYPECRNFNWNKIHNLDIGDFCKNPETGRLLFFHAHNSAYMVFFPAPGSAQPPLTFFFQMFERSLARNTTHYMLPEYFQSLPAKKIETNCIS